MQFVDFNYFVVYLVKVLHYNCIPSGICNMVRKQVYKSSHWSDRRFNCYMSGNSNDTRVGLLFRKVTLGRPLCFVFNVKVWILQQKDIIYIYKINYPYKLKSAPKNSTESAMAPSVKLSRTHPETEGDEIVISGMSGKFPNSDNINQYEYNLYNKVNTFWLLSNMMIYYFVIYFKIVIIPSICFLFNTNLF